MPVCGMVMVVMSMPLFMTMTLFSVMVMVVMMVPMVAGLFFLFVRRAAFDASDPSCGHRGLVEIEHLGVQYFVKVHICVVAVDYFRSRLKGAYDGPDFFQFFRLDF